MGYTHYLSKRDGQYVLTKKEQYIINECFRRMLQVIKLNGPDELLYLSQHESEFSEKYENSFHEYSQTSNGDMILLSGEDNFFCTKTSRKIYDPAVMLCYLLIDIATGKYKYTYDGTCINVSSVQDNGIERMFIEYLATELDGQLSYTEDILTLYMKYNKLLSGHEDWIPNPNMNINPKPFKGGINPIIPANTNYSSTNSFSIGDKVLYSGGVNVIERIDGVDKYKLKGVRAYKREEDIMLFDYVNIIVALNTKLSNKDNSTLISNSNNKRLELTTLNTDELQQIVNNVYNLKSQFKLFNGNIVELNLLHK